MLSYILMQDMSLATVFAGNFSNSAKINIEHIQKTVCFLIENATTIAIRTFQMYSKFQALPKQNGKEKVFSNHAGGKN